MNEQPGPRIQSNPRLHKGGMPNTIRSPQLSEPSNLRGDDPDDDEGSQADRRLRFFLFFFVTRRPPAILIGKFASAVASLTALRARSLAHSYLSQMVPLPASENAPKVLTLRIPSICSIAFATSTST